MATILFCYYDNFERSRQGRFAADALAVAKSSGLNQRKTTTDFTKSSIRPYFSKLGVAIKQAPREQEVSDVRSWKFSPAICFVLGSFLLFKGPQSFQIPRIAILSPFHTNQSVRTSSALAGHSYRAERLSLSDDNCFLISSLVNE